MLKPSASFNSFDIFDTLIQRTTLEPVGIFFRVRELMRDSGMDFPSGLVEDYPAARMGAESNVRYAVRSTIGISREISFFDIFQRLASVYGLNAEQVAYLAETEMACELAACQPRQAGIAQLLGLLDKKERVVLISDMYLPEAFIRQLLAQAEPRLTEVPLYLSATHGKQKLTGELFSLVAKSEGVDCLNWIHYGDNPAADGACAERLGIKPVLHAIPQFNRHERILVQDLDSYEAYCVAALMARYRFDHAPSARQEFAYARVSLYLATYVLWILNDATRKGIECLYFVSRDGYHLKKIADAVIKQQRLDISTAYLYGSRKVWLVPSFTDRIDDEFFLGLTSLRRPCGFGNVLEALNIGLDDFCGIFPEYSGFTLESQLDPADVAVLVDRVKGSAKYSSYLIRQASADRVLACQYLRENINPNEYFAFVEFWGRGFTQACFGRLLSSAFGKELKTEFYYARSVHQSDALLVRNNFTVNRNTLIPIERIFGNSPSGTVVAYEKLQGAVQPVTFPQDHDAALFSAMEHLLPRFAVDLCSAGFYDKVGLFRRLFDWSVKRFHEDLNDQLVIESYAHLKYSNRTFEPETEFAPPLGVKDIFDLVKGRSISTESVTVSLRRSRCYIVWLYHLAKNIKSKFSGL
ncbi:HAD family hydrolase [Castellaniella hirudinis]|uniref:HAD family hydrolase n=1 Tax=Castellaniella hirudinis TaxID=1144617 RepID=UPI0039C3ADD8